MIVSCSLAALAALCSAPADFLEIEVSCPIYFSGYTQYEIDGSDDLGSWRSRLKFPVNNTAVGVGVGFFLGEESELRFRGWGTGNEDAGTMRDDDWAGGVRDIWSRSDAELQAWGLSGEGTWWALRGPVGSLGPRLRVDYDRLDYDISNVRQWSLYPENVRSVDGPVLTYRQERISVIAGVGGRLRPVDWMEFRGFVGVSPWTYVWDEDDHLLRYKESEIQSLGGAALADVGADFIIADRVRLGAWGGLLYYKSFTAHQDQHFYGGEYAGVEYNDIDAEIERFTYMVGARIAVTF